MSVVCRLLDGPVGPLALHMGAGFDEPPSELLFMEIPGATIRWTRLEPDWAALADPTTRFEWYDLKQPEPLVEIGGNRIYPYAWREGYRTIVLQREYEDHEPLAERVRELREAAGQAALEAELGDDLQQTMRVRCDRCGVVHNLNFERFGTDWPDQLAGWGKGPEGDLCPECMVLQQAADRG